MKTTNISRKKRLLDKVNRETRLLEEATFKTEVDLISYTKKLKKSVYDLHQNIANAEDELGMLQDELEDVESDLKKASSLSKALTRISAALEAEFKKKTFFTEVSTKLINKNGAAAFEFVWETSQSASYLEKIVLPILTKHIAEFKPFKTIISKPGQLVIQIDFLLY